MPKQRIVNYCIFNSVDKEIKCPDYKNNNSFCIYKNYITEKCSKSNPNQLFGYAISDEEIKNLLDKT